MSSLKPILILLLILVAYAQNTTNDIGNITVTIPNINVTGKAAVQINAFTDINGSTHFIYICEYMVAKDDCPEIDVSIFDNETGGFVTSFSLGPNECSAGICRTEKILWLNGDVFIVKISYSGRVYEFVLRKQLGPRLEAGFLGNIVVFLIPFAIVAAFSIRGFKEAGAGMIAGGVFALLSGFIGADPKAALIIGVLAIVFGLLILALLK